MNSSEREKLFAKQMESAYEDQFKGLSVSDIPNVLLSQIFDERNRPLDVVPVWFSNTAMIQEPQKAKPNKHGQYELHPVFANEYGDTVSFPWLTCLATQLELIEDDETTGLFHISTPI